MLYTLFPVLPVCVTPHAQQSGESLEEQALYPWGHGVVSGRGAVVDINHKDSDDDGEGDKDHNEEQVLSNQWDDLGSKKHKEFKCQMSKIPAFLQKHSLHVWLCFFNSVFSSTVFRRRKLYCVSVFVSV